MAEVIDTAGLAGEAPKPVSFRREAVAAIRATLRKPDITDDEYDDALEALLELSKD